MDVQSTFLEWDILAVVTTCLKRKLINTDMKGAGVKKGREQKKIVHINFLLISPCAVI